VISFQNDASALYLGATREFSAGCVALFGVGFDSTTSFRPGTRLGPDAIRMVSDGLETYSPEQDRDTEDVTFCDLGNLEHPYGNPNPVVEAVHAATAEIVAKGGHPLMIGGEHSLTPPAVRALWEKYPDLVLVQWDAHADLRQDYLGEPNSHACAMRRCLDFLDKDSLVQVGIRSGTREEFQEMRGEERLVAPTAKSFAERMDRFKGRPVYLTVDLDVFDPAYLPGTGTPEPGGIDWPTFAAMLKVLDDFKLVAADVMELSPALDPTGVSSVLGCKVVRELILHLGR